MAFTIEIQPLGYRVRSENPINTLDAIRQAGIDLTAVCGGEGTCGKCVIQILESEADNLPSLSDQKHLSTGQIVHGFRLACMTTLNSNSKLYIPSSSLLTDQIMQIEGEETLLNVCSAVSQVQVVVDQANLNDLASDFTRIKLALGKPDLNADLNLLRSIPALLRDNGWRAHLLMRGNELIDVRREETAPLLGLAVDVGSTKIACYLVNLETGKTLTAKGTPNPQIAFGEDIMARLAAALQNPENAHQLHLQTMSAINDTAASMCRKIGLSVQNIVDFCLVGNTAMHHFFLNLPTGSLAVSPFVPVTTDPLYPPAQSLGLAAGQGIGVYIPPVKAGFIGSDHLAFIFASQFGTDERIRLGIDIGTNTEIALQAKGRIVSVSTASGPAFEGAHIAYGMRAAPGAIEHVTIDENGNAEIEVIGSQQPIGICGSGILDAVAQLRARSILNHRGRLIKEKDCIKPDINGNPAFYLTQGVNPITLSQKDIDQILLAKGAIRAGIDVLMDYLEIQPDQIEEVVIAGAFGSYMLPEHAMGIGMLPTIPLRLVKIAGNAAGTGARLMLLSTNVRREAEALAQKIEYLELTVYPDFALFYANGIRA